MKYRPLGRTGWKVSEISFGAWAIGGAWGQVSEEDALGALHEAVDQGVNFIDTADVYGDGRSERLIAQLRKARKDEIVVATKAGRRLPRQTVEGYSRQNLTQWIDDSLRNLATDALDLLQLHCPPTEVYYRPEVFAMLDDLVKAGKIRYYGVSVEKVEEGLKAIEFPNVQTVQIIFNCFRQRPADLFFPRARREAGGDPRSCAAGERLADRQAGARLYIRCRRPPHLQSSRPGLRCGRDLRRCGLRGRSRRGRADPGSVAGRSDEPVRPALDPHVRGRHLRHSRRQAPEQVAENCRASDLPPLSRETLDAVRRIYDAKIRPLVDLRW